LVSGNRDRPSGRCLSAEATKGSSSDKTPLGIEGVVEVLIMTLKAEGASLAALAKRFCVSRSAIQHVTRQQKLA
jgi:hypothetical protein